MCNLTGWSKIRMNYDSSFIHSFMEYWHLLSGTYTKSTTVISTVQRRAARFIRSRYTRYSSVSDMVDELEWPPLFQRRYEARLIIFYKIINGFGRSAFRQGPTEGTCSLAVPAMSPRSSALRMPYTQPAIKKPNHR